MVREESLIANLAARRTSAATSAGVLALLSLLFVVAACAPATPVPAAQAIKINIATAGVYRLTMADLQQAGLVLSPSDAGGLARLQLSYNGQPVAFDVEQAGSSAALSFYAPAPANPYSPEDVYVLAAGAGEGTAMQSRAVGPVGDRQALAAFQATLKLEQDLIYSSEPIGESHWFWQSLIAPVTKTVSVNLPAFQAGEVELQVNVAGVTTGEHLLRVAVNGQPGGETRWSGRSAESYTLRSPAFRSGDNSVSLSLPGASGKVDGIYLDSLAVVYPRRLSGANDSLEFEAGPDVRITGFPDRDVRAYDITEPFAPERLTGFETNTDGSATSIAFHDSRPGRRYLATAATGLKKPAQARPIQPNDLLSNVEHADYLVVAPRSFFAALQPLLEYRAAHGLKIRLVDVEQVYDAFSHSLPDPHAIRDLIRYAQDRWAPPAPRFVLLVGKASYDYRDNLKGPNKNLVPTYLVPTPHLGEAASDDWFVSPDGDPHPMLAVGRIPALTAAEVSAAVAKIIEYEDGAGDAAWRRRAIFVADNKQGSFNDMAETLASSLPPGITPSRVYLSANKGDVDATRSALVGEWNQGALLLLYIGHGSIDTWAAGPLFSIENSAEVQNEGRLPILITPTCLDGFFYHPDKTSLAEQLLFQRTGGIVAGLTPTGLSMEQAQMALMTRLFEALFKERAPTLGEAVVRGKQQMVNPNDDELEVLQTFGLLGDPALRWNPPN